MEISNLETYPDFFIVGAIKAGTTSLYNYLKEIPGIYMSHIKAPNYFLSLALPRHVAISCTKEEYLNLFRNVKSDLIMGEASAYYLCDPQSAKLIYEKVPNAKIIIVLRNPIERTFSHYLMYRHGMEDRTFSDAIRNKSNPEWGFSNFYLELGLYYEQVKSYIETFGSKNVKIIIFEKFTEHPKEIFKEVLEFLGIQAEVPQFVGEVHNPFSSPKGKIAYLVLSSKSLRKTYRKFFRGFGIPTMKKILLTQKTEKPKMNDKDRNFLENVFREDVKKLEKLLNIKIEWGI